MRALIKVFGMLVVLSNLGCSGDADTRQIDVNADIILNLLPSLSTSGYKLNFSFQSDSMYGCENVGYVYILKNTPDKINIHLLGVDLPESCVSGNAPAFEKLEVHGDEGYYFISIDIGDYIHNTGSLLIENSAYKIHMDSHDGMSIPNNVMYKIPVGTIWGYAIPADPILQNEVNAKVKEVLDPITSHADLKEGYYGYYSVTKPFGIYTEFPTYHNAQSCFAFHFTQNHAVLENAIEGLRAQLPANTDFKVFTWEGIEL